MGLIGLIGLIGVAFATSETDIVYPVAGLGGCTDKISCFSHCDNPANLDACLAFAEKHNLMPEEDLEFARAMGNRPGPGGCVGRQCEAYCDVADGKRMIECMEFVLNTPEIRATLPEEDLEEMPKVLAALKTGATLPPACQGKGRNCKDVCKNPSGPEVAEQCFAFAEEAGLLPPEFASNPAMKQMALKMMTEGGPGGCRGPDCQGVCEKNPGECLAWMEEQGFDPIAVIPEGAKEQIKQGLQMMKQGLAMAPPSARTCIEEALAPTGVTLADLESGNIKAMMKVGPDMEDIMQDCITGAFGGGGGFGPPAGFADEDEDEDEEEGFGPVGGSMPDPALIQRCMALLQNPEVMSGAVPPDPRCVELAQKFGINIPMPGAGFGPPGAGGPQGDFEHPPGQSFGFDDEEEEEPLAIYGNNLTARVLDTIADLLGF